MLGEAPRLISQCRTLRPINFFLYNSVTLVPQNHVFDLRESLGINSGSSDVERQTPGAVIAEDLLQSDQT